MSAHDRHPVAETGESPWRRFRRAFAKVGIIGALLIAGELRSASLDERHPTAETSESPWRKLRSALEIPAIWGAFAIALFARSGRGGEWAVLAFGLAFGHHVASEIQRGVTLPMPEKSILPRTYGYPRGAYVRSADPVGFWVLIALKGAIAATAVVFSLGELLGFWNV
jgi:hypothetical protein